jgi:hypothetical protein
MRKNKSLFLDTKSFNLMLERMDNRYTLDETNEKQKSLILEGFPKGVLGDLLSKVGKNINEIDFNLGRVGIDPNSSIGKAFKEGMAFFSDPKGGIRNIDIDSFIDTLKKMYPDSVSDVVVRKLKNIDKVSKAIEKGGNPVVELLEEAVDSGLGIENVEDILDDTLKEYNDIFEGTGIEGNGKYNTGDDIGKFLRKSIITDNGKIVDGVPSRIEDRIARELIKEWQNKPDGKIVDSGGVKDGDIKDGDVIYLDEKTGRWYKTIGNWAKNAFEKTSGFRKVVWKGSGMDWWWRTVNKGELVTIKGQVVKGTLVNIRKIQIRLAKGMFLPMPPVFAAFVTNCAYKLFLADPPDIDVVNPDTGKTKKYSYGFWQCFGTDFEVEAKTGRPVNEIGFVLYETLPIITVAKYTIVPSAMDWAGDKVKTYLILAEEAVNAELNKIFNGKSLPYLLNTKCDENILKTLEDYFKNELNNTNFGNWDWVLRKLPKIGDIIEVKSQLGEDATEQLLKLFGSFEKVKEWQEGMYEEIEKYVPESEKTTDKTYSIKDMMKLKCQTMRLKAIINAVNQMESNYTFPTATQPGKNTNLSLCENLKFWEKLSTPDGSGEWNIETCKENRNEIASIKTMIEQVEAYKKLAKSVENTLLDPAVWDTSCSNLVTVHEGSPSIAEWICELDPNKTIGETPIEFEAVTEETTVESIVYNYSWEKATGTSGEGNLITAANTMIGILNDNAASEGTQPIKPNEPGSGLIVNEQGLEIFDLCNPNVQKLWIDDYWCLPKRITKIGTESGKTTGDCVTSFKNYLKEQNICS